METTLKTKAKLFAQYLFQKVFYHDEYGTEVAHLDTIHLSDRLIQPGYKLLLKPLSSITDEDAKECANILIDNADSIRDKDEARIHYWHGLKLAIADNSNTFISNVEIYQYLQSKGYALPYNGLSIEKLIELDWIKLRFYI